MVHAQAGCTQEQVRTLFGRLRDRVRGAVQRMRRKADAQRGVLPASAHGGGQSRVQAPSVLPDGDSSQPAEAMSAAQVSSAADAVHTNGLGASTPSTDPASAYAGAQGSPLNGVSEAVPESQLSAAHLSATEAVNGALPGATALTAGYATFTASVVRHPTSKQCRRPCACGARMGCRLSSLQ